MGGANASPLGAPVDRGRNRGDSTWASEPCASPRLFNGVSAPYVDLADACTVDPVAGGGQILAYVSSVELVEADEFGVIGCASGAGAWVIFGFELKWGVSGLLTWKERQGLRYILAMERYG